MKRDCAFHRAGIVLLLGFSLLLNGCGDKTQTYNILLECDDVVAKKSVRVDLIPVSKIDLPEWEAYPVSKYWQPQNTKRAGADKITKNFGLGQPKSYVLKLSDPEIKAKWRDWLNRRVSHLVVIADLDSVTDDAAGSADPRRKIIPLNKKSWPDTSTLRILVQDGGVRVDGLEKLPKST
jgi:hypothetical protein